MFEALVIGYSITEHIDHGKELNERHPSISLVLDDPWENFDPALVMFKNSYDKWAFGFGSRYEFNDYTFVEGGLVTGYKEQSGLPLTPFGRAGFMYGPFDAFIFPSTDGEDIRLGIGVGIRWEIK